MSEKFPALIVREQGRPELTELAESDLMPGDVTIAVEYSTVNYKDGMALNGKLPSFRKLPLIPGIDLAGTVIASTSPRFAAGDRVVQNGFGVGENHHGGYAGRARVKSDVLVKLPDSLSTARAMAIGTAGYTAMLCVVALEKAGVKPEQGDVLVTGAAGGVGSVAIALLTRLGYRVVASSRRAAEEGGYLQSLGAAEVIDAAELAKESVPLAKERWAAAIDSVGSTTLANVLAATRYDGAVAACGLAQGMDLPTTVMPFILRDVSLLGCDSVMAPLAKREESWSRLARDLDLARLDAMTSHVSLAEVPAIGAAILEGKVRGRVVVDIGH
jgi:acrylyl-CoA reductase (NADPH)